MYQILVVDGQGRYTKAMIKALGREVPEPPKECDSYVPSRNERTYTPNHRKHNKRGKFKRSKR